MIENTFTEERPRSWKSEREPRFLILAYLPPPGARGASWRIIIAWRTKDINYSRFSCLGRSATAIPKHLPFSLLGVSRLGVYRFSFGHHPLLLHSLLRNA
jgi:hypothetical protein